jgi:ParB/RepB/Spo0J family partition protein
MPKIEQSGSFRKISLGQIVDAGNVRKLYEELDELAESIKTVGQLEPILVKALGKNADGVDEYELIAGHRRYRAFQILCNAGESFTMIDALIIAGDKLTLQLVENLQRSDLTAPERESGIAQMCNNGLSQREAAARLAKSEQYVSRHITAWKIRFAAESAGIDTSELATATLNEIQGADPIDIPDLVKWIVEGGGTSNYARTMMKDYRRRRDAREPKMNLDPPPKLSASKDDSVSTLPPEPEEDSAEEESDTAPPEKSEPESAPKKPAPSVEKPAPKAEPKKPAPERAKEEDFDPPHKTVDFNDVCLAIAGYAKARQKETTACLDQKGYEDCINDCGGCESYYKMEAARDIIALLHARL